jgi:replicative DNA helicase
MVSSKSGVPVRELPNSYDKATDAVSSYIGQGIHIADVTNNSAVKILGMIRSAKIRYDIGVVVIDYLQLVSDKSQKSREQEVGQITRSLKNIAKELHICVVALSQLRRSPGSNYPTLSRLRDSGQVEEAADVVVFVYRPEVYGVTEWDDGTVTENEAEIIIAKGRNYGIGKFRCRFIKEITKFGDFSDRTRHEGLEGVSSPVKEDLPF